MFCDAILERSNLETANLAGADLRRADLGFARLDEAIVRKTRFDGSRLARCWLTQLDCSGASRVEMVLDNRRLEWEVIRDPGSFGNRIFAERLIEHNGEYFYERITDETLQAVHPNLQSGPYATLDDALDHHPELLVLRGDDEVPYCEFTDQIIAEKVSADGYMYMVYLAGRGYEEKSGIFMKHELYPIACWMPEDEEIGPGGDYRNELYRIGTLSIVDECVTHGTEIFGHHDTDQEAYADWRQSFGLTGRLPSRLTDDN